LEPHVDHSDGGHPAAERILKHFVRDCRVCEQANLFAHLLGVLSSSFMIHPDAGAGAARTRSICRPQIDRWQMSYVGAARRNDYHVTESEWLVLYCAVFVRRCFLA
jgi:hypothetical protein